MRRQLTRLGDFFGAGEGWVRPAPPSLRPDVLLAAVFWVVSAVVVELLRVMGAFAEGSGSPLWQHVAVATGTLLLAGRRRWPLVTALASGLHMFVVGVTQPMVMSTAPMQVAYFLALYSAVAWARDRQQMAAVVTAIVLLMFLWIAVVTLLGSSLDQLVSRERSASLGPLTPGVAAGIFVFLVNAAYFGGAVGLGQRAWLGARQAAQVADQRTQLAEQAAALRDQAVTEERLRIARELHDVVAHHVSVMGVQAAAARTVMPRDPDRAAEALRTVEESSREAVAQMRGLLGTLRHRAADPEQAAEGTSSAPDPYAAHQDSSQRSPQPGLGQLSRLVESAAVPGLHVTLDVVASPPGADREVPEHLGLAVYRIVQEALTNTRRHSTATTASVVVRVAAAGGEGGAGPDGDHRDGGHLEVEVLDNGRPRGPATGGSGLGLLGVRERIRTLGGTADIGPRATGGYRVRVRFPLRRNVARREAS